ncbi:hypothetical protein IT072_16730 [Leifsonia sp. ZF2019]|uniref:hypothetical protein n=1 Tax=Leifsonia sp. ZF2019 TaxID=2781978 RepID=UPI001CBAA16B|nr:hypothetical protein [Leifsonia sp. ZF2019]UAJ78852.1 hypothetical protein IT072_16730 [Leifsonia sp. ZF2019]
MYTGQLAGLEAEEARRPKPISIPEEIVHASGRRHDEKTPIPVRVHVPVQVAYSDVELVDADAIAWTSGGLALVCYTPAGEEGPGPKHS